MLDLTFLPIQARIASLCLDPPAGPLLGEVRGLGSYVVGLGTPNILFPGLAARRLAIGCLLLACSLLSGLLVSGCRYVLIGLQKVFGGAACGVRFRNKLLVRNDMRTYHIESSAVCNSLSTCTCVWRWLQKRDRRPSFWDAGSSAWTYFQQPFDGSLDKASYREHSIIRLATRRAAQFTGEHGRDFVASDSILYRPGIPA